MIFSVPADNWSQVQYPFSRTVMKDCIQDVQDGTHYQKLSGPGNFFSVPEHTGLILCADGVPLFKSSGKILLQPKVALQHVEDSRCLGIELVCLN